jgi:mannose-6-phosphate isomerase-like protein (cupin superfamily)
MYAINIFTLSIWDNKMNNSNVLLNKFNSFKKEKDAFVIKNYFNIDFSWEEAIEFFDVSSKTESKYEALKDDLSTLKKNNLISRFVPGYLQGSIPLPHNKITPMAEHLFKDILNCKFEGLDSVQFFSNLPSCEYSSFIHADDFDVFFIEMIGQTRWDIYKDNNKINSFVINPGDVIVVPAGTYHQVNALSPRFGVSIGFNELDYSKI